MSARTVDYNAHFSPAKQGQLLGEGSVSYSSYKDEDISIERIFECNSNCRFIFIARNPWKRIESSFREMHHSGVKFGLNAPFSLAENLELFPQMIKDSLFFERISKYVAAFGEEAIIVLFLEDLIRQPQHELARCFRHLGIDDTFEVDTGVKLNQANSKLYDTRILRYLRNHPRLGMRLAKLNPEAQDRLLRPIGLRRPFSSAIKWDSDSVSLVREQVIPDSKVFLERYGKPVDFWRYQPSQP